MVLKFTLNLILREGEEGGSVIMILKSNTYILYHNKIYEEEHPHFTSLSYNIDDSICFCSSGIIINSNIFKN